MNKGYRKIDTEARKEIAALYVSGMSVKNIARKMKCSQSAVYLNLKASGIARRSRGPRVGSGFTPGPIYDNPELLARASLCRRLFNEEGFTVNQLMDLFSRGRTTISNYLTRPDQEVPEEWEKIMEERFRKGELG